MDVLMGKNVFVRTVTNYFTGRLAAVDDQTLQLDDAAWVADTGRFADALSKGSLTEVEPYPGTVFVNRGAVTDVCEWLHELPRAQK